MTNTALSPSSPGSIPARLVGLHLVAFQDSKTLLVPFRGGDKAQISLSNSSGLSVAVHLELQRQREAPISRPHYKYPSWKLVKARRKPSLSLQSRNVKLVPAAGSRWGRRGRHVQLVGGQALG